MRNIIITLVAALTLAASAQNAGTSVDELNVKARRFYAAGEWNAASAMYMLILDARPDSTAVYGPAMCAAAMQGDSLEQMRLLRLAISHRLAVDSVFASVERASLALGQTHLYERFLQRAAVAEPWLSRNIEGRLLDYYTFRCDGEGMVRTAQTLLRGLPDDPRFLMSLARGYMICGRPDDAMATYRRVIQVDAGNVDAMLYLAYYELSRTGGDRAEAIRLLTEAQRLRPRPYVAHRLDALR